MKSSLGVWTLCARGSLSGTSATRPPTETPSPSLVGSSGKSAGGSDGSGRRGDKTVENKVEPPHVSSVGQVSGFAFKTIRSEDKPILEHCSSQVW